MSWHRFHGSTEVIVYLKTLLHPLMQIRESNLWSCFNVFSQDTSVVGWMMVPTKIYPCLNLQNLWMRSYFEKSLCTSRWCYLGLSGYTLNPMTSVLIIVKIGEIKKKVIWRQPKVGVKQQQAKEHVELADFERGKDGFTPSALKKHSPSTSWFDTSGLQNCATIIFPVISYPVCA